MERVHKRVMERNLLCFVLRRVKRLSCHSQISLGNCFLTISLEMEVENARLSLPSRVSFAHQLSLVGVHTDLTRKSRVLNSCQVQHRAKGGSDALLVLTMNQKRKAAEARNLLQVTALAAPRTGAAHAAGAGDNHLARLAHHGVCVHGARITQLRSPGAEQCSGRGASTRYPDSAQGPPPPFSFVAIRLNHWSRGRDPRLGPRVCRDPRNN